METAADDTVDMLDTGTPNWTFHSNFLTINTTCRYKTADIGEVALSRPHAVAMATRKQRIDGISDKTAKSAMSFGLQGFQLCSIFLVARMLPAS
jgi:hypothetical protein